MSQYNIDASRSDDSIPIGELLSHPDFQAVSNDIENDLGFSAKGLPGEIIAKLDILNALDKHFEKKQSTATTHLWVSGAFMIVFGLLAIPTFGITLLLAIPALIWFVISCFRYSKYKRLNVVDRRYLMPRGLLERLEMDIPPGSAVELVINFNHYKHSDFLQEQTGGFLSAQTSSKFELPWLSMKGRFMDGTQFKLRVTTNVKRKEKRKSKATKVTETFKEKFNLTLQVDPTRYDLMEGLAPLLQTTRRSLTKGIAMRVHGEGSKAVIQQMGAPRRYQSTRGGQDDPYGRQSAFGLIEFFKKVYDALEQLKIDSTSGGSTSHV